MYVLCMFARKYVHAAMWEKARNIFFGVNFFETKVKVEVKVRDFYNSFPIDHFIFIVKVKREAFW